MQAKTPTSTAESTSKTPKLSVCVVTYNQEKYIHQCLQSIVDQETDFEFEVIVGDDASTDNTAKIIRQFKENYPNIIKPIFRSNNIGPGLNIADTYRNAKGRYIAHLDGDDFMLPGKLKKQIKIMDENDDVEICSHNMVYINNNKSRLLKSFQTDRKLTMVDLYKNLPFFANSSKIFRNHKEWSDFSFIKNDTADFEVHLTQAERGYIYHMSDFLGVYNENIGISFSGKRVNTLLPISTRRVFKNALLHGVPGLSINELKKLYSMKILSYAYHSARLGHTQDARKYAIESINIKLHSPLQILIYISSFTKIPPPILVKLKLIYLMMIKSRNEK